MFHFMNSWSLPMQNALTIYYGEKINTINSSIDSVNLQGWMQLANVFVNKNIYGVNASEIRYYLEMLKLVVARGIGPLISSLEHLKFLLQGSWAFN